jgi:hypothetical protein
MGREIRRVPPDWQHPKDEDGDHIPLFDESFRAAAQEWDTNARLWEQRLHPDQKGRADLEEMTYSDWSGDVPIGTRPRQHTTRYTRRLPRGLP